MQRADDFAEKLQDDFERSHVEDGRLDALKEGLKEAEDQKTIHEDSYENAVTQKDSLNETSRRLKHELQQCDDLIREHEAKVNKATMKAQRVGKARVAALHEKNAAFQIVDDLQQDKSQIGAKLEKQSGIVTTWNEAASKVSARVNVDPGETPESLDKKLEKLMSDVERFQREYESIAWHRAAARLPIIDLAALEKPSRKQRRTPEQHSKRDSNS